MNTALYLLRCVQLGFSVADLEYLSVGLVFDAITEAGNDSHKYKQLATQADFDRF